MTSTFIPLVVHRVWSAKLIRLEHGLCNRGDAWSDVLVGSDRLHKRYGVRAEGRLEYFVRVAGIGNASGKNLIQL
jgi:hypothetical protein